jgi:aryl-alcohol dehydrogenase-like predicted oxidoreductase
VTASTITLSDSLTVNRLGFGAMRVPQADDPLSLIRQAIDGGVTFLDTADIYGNGRSEELIAEALHPYPDDLVIATKAGFDGHGDVRNGSLPPAGHPTRLKACC